MGLIRTPCGTGQETLSICHEGEVLCCDLAENESWAISGGWDGRIIQWDRASGTPLAQWSVTGKPITTCRVSNDARSIFTGSMDGLFAEFDAETQERKLIFLLHTRPISGIDFSPDGKLVATSSWDQTLCTWPLANERDRRPLIGHGDIVAGCKFLPDNKHLLSWSHDLTLCVWELNRGRPVATLRGHEDRITAADVSPDGKWFVSSGRDSNIILWDASTFTEVARYSHQRGEIVACRFTPDAELVLIVSAKGDVVSRTVPEFHANTKQATQLAAQCAVLAGNGEQLAIGTADGRLHLVGLEGMPERAICVTAQETHESRPKFMDRLLGREAMRRVLRCCCPICHFTFEITHIDPATMVCPDCKKRLHVNSFTLHS